MAKASMTGILLADLLARTKHDDGFILFGHSLGARVIYYTLGALSTSPQNHVHKVCLLGGAIERRDKEGWKTAAASVRSEIHNYYSEKDSILKYLYQGANALLSRPIGLGPITLDESKIVNHDVSETVNHHMDYKDAIRKFS